MEQDWHDDESQQQLHQQRWHRRVTKSLAYAASHGNSGLVQRILNDERLGPFLNVDDSDDKSMGTTPLIYASCFGYASIVQLLLDAGASVDVQDKIGWSPLMWATTNNHKAIVEILLAHGASWTNRTAKGRTVLDFVDYNNQELIQVLTPTPDQRPTQLDSQQQEFYKQMKLYRRRRQSSTLPKLVLDNDDDVYDYYDSTTSMESLHHFVWHRCLPDQMFVFAEDDIEHILHVTISSLKLPMKTRQEIWVPSNVLFLCARYAHYYSARELLHGILSGAISKIANVLQNNKGDIHTLAFWMANLSQLLYYLKKDTGLVVATAEHQLEISELVSETYVLLVTDSEKRMDRILEPSMLDHDLIGADPVDFADDWQRFFRHEQHHSMDQPTSPMNSLSSFMSSTSVTSPSCTTLSPHSITSLLSSILYVLQSYEVHPTIIVQAIAQFFHFMSCELFNRILMNKKYMCRSKALQVRMNLSIIEDWVREQQPYLPIHLTSYFDPLIQLLQLLQCVSQLNDLTTFIGTLHGFELLNPLQIRRCVLNYRYEVDEPRLPDQVEKYTIQLAQ
ncbi:uncharacterized protein BX664DRAFT_267646, partial [Halteromyces radiatus]|uniref:uncharacterized protein n=1 Tax=Halteromyces radiatus TaxID=101107 RepID=UPI0022207506